MMFHNMNLYRMTWNKIIGRSTHEDTKIGMTREDCKFEVFSILFAISHA